MFAQIYTDSTSDNNPVRHWLLYKDTTDQSGMFDGIMTKNNSTTANNPSPKIDCCTKLFDEMSSPNVRYHKVACYQDLLDAMTAAK